VDACTVTALDAITAFAVPNPADTSQCSRFFGSGGSLGSPRRNRSLSLLRVGYDLLPAPFRAVDESDPIVRMKIVNAQGWCKYNYILMCESSRLSDRIQNGCGRLI